jgi:Raf kinase inhibitor-like YbhB/YbcL family protein
MLLEKGSGFAQKRSAQSQFDCFPIVFEWHPEAGSVSIHYISFINTMSMKGHTMFRTSLFAAIIATITIATPAAADTFKLTSSMIAEGQQLDAAQVFAGFGCEGGNTAPDLAWSSAPKGTQSFAVTVYDPDAPTGSGWWHWFAFNIPADATGLSAGDAMREGVVELSNDYGATGFGGACPPPGEVHRYQFTVHALGIVLELDDSFSNALAGFMVNANSIASDTITAVYSR